MKQFSSYKVKMKHYNKIFEQTVAIYRNAVSFFLDICDKEWKLLEPLKNLERCSTMEKLSLETKKNPNPKYDFNEKFYKMPSYLRRSAIHTAIGCYASYHLNLKNWEVHQVGKKPTLQLDRSVMPAFYKGNMYIRTNLHTASIKIFHQNDWVWLSIELNLQDVKYIQTHCTYRKECVPTLKKEGKCWYLVFPFEENVTFEKVAIEEQTICAVDLGINNPATCSIM